MPPAVFVNMLDPEGRPTSVPASEVRERMDAGYTSETAAQMGDRIQRSIVAERNSGVLNTIKAGVHGVLKGATLGLNDVASAAFSTPDEMRELRELEDAHPWASGGGEVVGMIAPALLSGGASLGATGGRAALRTAARYSPAGALSRLGTGIVERGLARRVAATVGGGAVEGAVGNAGLYLSDVALGRRDLSAEGFVGAMGGGALYGGVASGALLGIEKGMVSARSLFARATSSARAAEAAESRAVREVGASLEGTEATVAQARALAREEIDKTAPLRPDERPPWTPEATWAPIEPKAPLPKIAPIPRATPTWETVTDGELWTLDPSMLRERGVVSLPAGQRASANTIRAAGKETEPVRLAVRGDGSFEVLNNGRDRVLEAIKAGTPVRAILDRGVKKIPKTDSATSIFDAALDALGPVSAPVPTTWREFTRGKMGPYMKSEGSHAGAMKRLSREWKERQATPRSAVEPVSADVPVPKLPDTTTSALTPTALDDSARLVQSPKARRLTEVATEAEEAATGVRDFVSRTSVDARAWVRDVRAGIAKRSGGFHTSKESIAHSREDVFGTLYNYTDTVSPGRTIDATGAYVQVPTVTGPADDIRALFGLKDPELNSQYADLIEKAARETDSATRNQFLNDAADFEAEHLEMSVRTKADIAENQRIIDARKRSGLDNVAVAARNADLRASAFEYFNKERASHPQEPGRRALLHGGDERAVEAYIRTMRAAPDVHAEAIRNSLAVPRIDRVPFADEAYEAIEVFGRLERANSELVEAVGADVAHPAAKAAAQDYAQAVDEQGRKVAERVAQHADDVASGSGGAAAAVDTAKSDLAAIGRGARRRRIGGAALDAITAMEALRTAGVPGMPDVQRIPVIGGLLRLWLQARAANKVLGGGLTGKIAAHGEGRLAILAARTRDRATRAVDRLLDVGAKAARRGRSGAAMTAKPAIDILRHQLFDDGTNRPAPETEAEAAMDRIDELSVAQANPAQVQSAARRALADVSDPDLVREVTATLQRKLSHLAAVMPKEPPPTMLGRAPWKPSKSEIVSFSRAVRAAEDPSSVLEDLAAGRVTPEAAGAFRAVYPQLYAEAAGRLMDRAAELEARLPYQRVLQLGVLFEAPLVENLIPERIAALQSAGTELGTTPSGGSSDSVGGSTKPPVPSVARPPDLDSLYTTAADRRAMRRAS